MLLSFEVATHPQGAAISTLSPSASAAAISVLPKGFFVKSQLGRLGSFGKKPQIPRASRRFPLSRREPVPLPVLGPIDGDLAAAAHAETGWLAISPTAARPIGGCDSHARVCSAAHLQPGAGACGASIACADSVDGRRVANLTRTHVALAYTLVCKRRRERDA
jgi:hypothetical protein